MVKPVSLPGQEQSTAPTWQNPSTDEERPKQTLIGNLKLGEKCPKCKEILYIRDWEKNLKVCPRCNYHFRLSAHERITWLVDPGSCVELDKDLVSVDPLHFTTHPPAYADQRPYTKKLIEAQQ